jgi:hypothetical protein
VGDLKMFKFRWETEFKDLEIGDLSMKKMRKLRRLDYA